TVAGLYPHSSSSVLMQLPLPPSRGHSTSHLKKYYQCHLCPRSYDYKGSLEIHMRTHTGDAPFQCSHCSLRVKDKSNLRRHIRRRHLGQLQTSSPAYADYTNNMNSASQ
ncbi:hypothetical protein SK128_005434, partial [Halocaridina rubra]